MHIETSLENLKKMRKSWENMLNHAPCMEMVESLKDHIRKMDDAISKAETDIPNTGIDGTC